MDPDPDPTSFESGQFQTPNTGIQDPKDIFQGKIQFDW
jgi:hypothetical protein